MRNRLHALALLGGAILVPNAANADPGAAIACPPIAFLNIVNYATNPSFENIGPEGPLTIGPGIGPGPASSAAAGWFMHSNNAGARVISEVTTTHAPGPNGQRMLRFVAGGSEGGIYQALNNAPAKVMFSVWVFVKAGRAQIQVDALSQGPIAWSTKTGEWEQLRVCTDGAVQPGWFSIYNQDARGGEFFVDRVEVRALP